MSEKTPFKLLISHEEAVKIILEHVQPIDRTEWVSLDEAFKRVLAEDLIADRFVPPFDRSAMDGYAVKAEDTFGASSFNPKTLALIEVVYAGTVPHETLEVGDCTQIATGCPLPKGADAVVMVEFTEKDGEQIKVLKPVYPGANISRKGEDIEEGKLVLNDRSYLTSAKVGVFAALGRERVKVYEKPRVTVVPTGSEVCAVGTKLGEGQVYDINSHTLAAIASENGALVTRFKIVPDTREALEGAIKALRDQDMIVVAGGSSVGERDLLNGIIEQLGTVLFHGVQVKPGKPTLFGVVEEKPVFGMPGYPTSCLSNAFLFLIPSLRKLSRLPPRREEGIKARLAERVVSSSGRKQFLTVQVRDGFAYPVFRHSGAITSMAEADGYIVLPTNVDVIEKGDEVTVLLINE
jgi:molybdenum cofactor synthesis domain-containing protein